VLHKIVPKPPKWVLPEQKEGQHNRGRLSVFERQSNCGDPDEFYTIPDLLKRNLICVIIHFFTMVTEPWEYFRFCFMDE